MSRISPKSILYWIPSLLWMLVIYTLSSRQRIEVAEIHIVNFIIFKTLHVIEYFILCILFSFAMTKNKSKHSVQYAIYLAVIFALSDEIHQMGVPTREGVFRDILVDSIGIFISAVFFRKFAQSRIK